MAAAGGLLLTSGLILAGAFLAWLVFRRMGIPDVLLLLLLGAVLALAGLLPRGEAAGLVPLLGAMALVVVLFEGGLRLRVADLREGLLPGLLLAVVVFSLTTILVAASAHLALGLAPGPAALLGMALGGAGILIVLPLVRALRASPHAEAVVTVEAVASDVLVVLGVVSFSTLLMAGSAEPHGALLLLTRQASVGLVGGAAAGFAFAAAARLLRPPAHAYPFALGCALLAYVAVEGLGGSGLVAVLAYGLVLGNFRVTPLFADPWRGRAPAAPALGQDALVLQGETVFVVRGAFFVLLGASFDVAALATPALLGAAVLLAAAVAGARLLGSALTLRRMEARDRQVTAAMFPLGIAAAAASLLPTSLGVPGAESLPLLAAAAIVGTNAAAAVGVAVLARRPQSARAVAAAAIVVRK